jgi:para-aminobenzoate synthetase/4-amino-4-deoxychorismate lyase
VAGPADDPFATLAAQPVVDPGAPAGAVGGGWFGFLGYRLGARVEELPPGPPRPVALPDFALAFYDHVLRCDADGRWWFEALWTPARDQALRARLRELRERLEHLDDAPAPRAELGPFALAPPGAAGHVAAVAACRERIAAGELFQANLCLRLEGRFGGEPEALYAQAAAALRPDRAALVAGPWGALVSLSPELFLARHGRTVTTAPIKGTAPHGARAALESSEKDRAENVMIVDLMRNDLGRVCAYGSVRAGALAAPRGHTGVWHLVSEVSGTLRDDAGDDDLLRACFPPGSVTGAPKVQAQLVIAELEATGREAYTGAIGFASPVAGLELSVAIRTFELCGERAWLGAGGGVTWGSDPAAELEECMVKARPLLAAAGSRLADEAPARHVAKPSTAPPDALALVRGAARPDPALGVFTTVLVEGGAPVRLAGHLARLAASVAALGGPPPDPALAARARAAAAALAGGRGRLRLDWDPASPGDVAITTGPLPRAAGDPLRLAPVTLPGGLGAHKWRDRRLLDALATALGAVPLIADADGHALEAAWAALLALQDGALVAPPEDGRLLPSTARAAVLADAAALGIEARVEPLPLERLVGADALLIASALRGPLPAVLDRARRTGSSPHPAIVELHAAWTRGVPPSAHTASWTTSRPSSSGSSSRSRA